MKPVISVVLNFVIVACVTYYNNDYTDIASEYTGEMRQRKAEQRADYIGEIFFDDLDGEE